MKLRIVFIKKGKNTCEFPKPLYFSSNFTFSDFKQYLIRIFPFLHGKREFEIRFWKLFPGGIPGFTEFMKYYRFQLENHVFFEKFNKKSQMRKYNLKDFHWKISKMI